MLALKVLDQIRVYSPSAANLLLSKALPWIIPSSAGYGIRVEELTAERAVSSLPLRRKTRNHVGSMYFGVQMTLAEMTMGILLFKHFPPGPYNLLVVRSEADFHAKAKGALRAICDPSEEVWQTLSAVDSNETGKAQCFVPVRLVTAKEGTLVTEARFLAALKRFAPKH